MLPWVWLVWLGLEAGVCGPRTSTGSAAVPVCSGGTLPSFVCFCPSESLQLALFIHFSGVSLWAAFATGASNPLPVVGSSVVVARPAPRLYLLALRGSVWCLSVSACALGLDRSRCGGRFCLDLGSLLLAWVPYSL